MPPLSVYLREAARSEICRAFSHARTRIEAEFYSIHDPAVIAALNEAARRGVRVTVSVEGDVHRYGTGRAREPSDAELREPFDPSVDVIVSRRPRPLVHGKAAVIDDALAVIGTANETVTGLRAPGEVMIEDTDARDVAAVRAKLDAAAAGSPVRSGLRAALDSLFRSRADLRIASEDLSDPLAAAWLIHRARQGHHDRVLVGRKPSRFSVRMLRRLAGAGVSVRAPSQGYMHEKFVDGGDRIYVGSANLTRNGLDESHEVGVVAPAADFGSGAAALRDDFDHLWNRARSV